jgi:hypothetical protein
MDADAVHLQRFSDVPYVIEAPASKGGLLGAAASALARTGARVRIDEGRGMAPERYRGMIESIRRDLQANLSATPGYAIDVYDISNPDREGEVARIHHSLRGGGKIVHRIAAGKGAYASGFRTSDEAAHCIVVGLRPDVRTQAFLANGTGRAAVASGSLDEETFQRTAIVHEIGHCLLGASEAKADAFAMLMSLRDPGFDKATVAAWASWREREEWTLAVTEDDHNTAKALWAILERADELRADPAFRALDIEGIAGLAKAFVEERGFAPGEEAEVASVRRGIRAGVLSVAPRAGLKEGASPLFGWLRGHADIPAVGRIVALVDNALEGARPLPPFEARPGEFRAAIAALADKGDPVAKAIAKGYDAAPRTDTKEAREVASLHKGNALERLIPYRFPRTSLQARATARLGAAPPVAAMEAEDAVPGGMGHR